MTVKLQLSSSSVDRLSPPPTDAELAWWKRERRRAYLGVAVRVGAMTGAFALGAVLRTSRTAMGGLAVCMGIGALLLLASLLRALGARSPVAAIRAKRADDALERRKEEFLAALDEDSA